MDKWINTIYLKFIFIISRMQKFSAFILSHDYTWIFNINLQIPTVILGIETYK